MEEKKDYGMPFALIISCGLIAASIYATGGIKIIGNTDSQANLAGNEPPAEIIMSPVVSTEHILGNAKAEVFIVSYTDLECPFCKKFHYTMKQIIDEYGKSGKVAWVLRHFPLDQLHQQSRTEAEATECVASLGGNDKFWAFTDKIMASTNSNDGLDMSLLPKFAGEVGLNKTAYESCMKKDAAKKTVEAYQADGISAGARGTPYSVIITKNGEKLPIDGALPYEQIKGAIEYALK